MTTHFGTPVSAAALTGIILAGGRATRMGGRDKGLVLLHGRPLVAHVVERLRPQVGRMMLNANRNLDAYGRFGLPVVADRTPHAHGPLAGIAAGLLASESEWVLTVPCDTPFAPEDLAERLMRACRAERRAAAVASVDGVLQPLFALLHRSLRDDLERFLAQGGRKVRTWIETQHPARVAFSDPGAFLNLNTPGEIDALEPGTAAC